MPEQTAEVNVLHPILTGTGWVYAGRAEMPLEEAKAHAKSGRLEIMTVGGVPYVYAPCCGGHGASG